MTQIDVTIRPHQTRMLPVEVQSLLEKVPAAYLPDLTVDLAWAALIAPRRPDALYEVAREWEITLEEIHLAGDELADIMQACVETRDGIGMSAAELQAYLEDNYEQVVG